MKGYLFVTKEGWFVVYDQRTFQDPSAEDGILPLHPESIADTSISFYNGKEVEFEQIELVDKLDSYQNCIFKTYAKIININKKRNFVFSDDQDLSLNKEEGVWELGLEQELNKLPYTKHLDDGQYNDGQIAGFELGATWCYNKVKKNYEVKSSVRELHQYKLGLEDAYNKVKELNKQPMIDSQTEISDEEISQEFKSYSENWEVRQALEEGAKWYKNKIKNK